MKESYYRLIYVNDDIRVTVKFNAINIGQVQEQLESFLLASGWSKELVNDLFNQEL